MSDFYSAIVFLSAFIMIIMVLLVRSNDLVEYSEKQTIYTISVLVIAGALSEWLAVWMDGADPSLRLLHVILKTIELSTAPVIPVLCSSLIRPIRRKKAIFGLLSIHVLLEILFAFWGLDYIFWVDEQGCYHRGAFYWAYALAYIGGMLFFTALLLSESTRHYGTHRTLAAILPLFFFCGLLIEYQTVTVRITWLCASVAILMVYILYSELRQKTDALTHLLNRSSYESRLAALREQCERLPHVSVGYACYHPERDSIEDVIARADRMMYHYKRKLKDTVQLAGDASK